MKNNCVAWNDPARLTIEKMAAPSRPLPVLERELLAHINALKQGQTGDASCDAEQHARDLSEVLSRVLESAREAKNWPNIDWQDKIHMGI